MTALHGIFKTRQDNFITFLQNTLLTDLAPQVAKASRGRPGTIKEMKSANLSLKGTYYRKSKRNGRST